MKDVHTCWTSQLKDDHAFKVFKADGIKHEQLIEFVPPCEMLAKAVAVFIAYRYHALR